MTPIIAITCRCPRCGAGPASIAEPTYSRGGRLMDTTVRCERGHVYRWQHWTHAEEARRMARRAHYDRLARELREVAEQTRDPWTARVCRRAAEIAPILGQEDGE